MSPEQLLSFNLSIVPCKPGTKMPFVRWKPFQTVRPSLKQVQQWQKQFKGCGWAIICGTASGIHVLDLDTAEAWDDALRRGGWGETPIVKTGRPDGRQVYFRCPPGGLPKWIKTAKNGETTLFDFQGNGSIVIAPGSLHKSGNLYEWIESIADVGYDDVPPWLVELSTPIERPERAIVVVEGKESDSYARNVARKAFRENIAELRALPHGDRDNQLFKKSRRLFEFVAAGHLDENEVQQGLEDAARAFDTDPAHPVDFNHALETIRHGKEGARPVVLPVVMLPATNGNGVAHSAPIDEPAPVEAPPEVPPADPPPIESLADIEATPEMDLTDAGNGTRFAARYMGLVMYDYSHNRWMLYDGTRYQPDTTNQVHEFAEGLTMEMAAFGDEIGDQDLWKWAIKSRSRDRLKAMQEGAKSKTGISVTVDELDRNPMLLNLSNGTLDLSGEMVFRPHDRGNRLTKLAPVVYDPEATAPLFLETLNMVQPDEPTRTYFQTRMAHTMTGAMDLQEFYICYGLGANGKSTLLEHVFLKMMGDYATAVNAATFQLRPYDNGPRADLVSLIGKRFVLMGESNEGRKLDEAMIKAVTGGDSIRARLPHAPNDIEFSPTFKPWQMTNHLNGIEGVEHAIWRRVKMFPWDVTITKVDKTVKDRIQREFSGVLNWLLEGLRLLRQDTVMEPAKVTLAVERYRSEQDKIAAFLDDACTVATDARVSSKGLIDSYHQWCKDNREEPLSNNTFAKKLLDRGFKKGKSGAVRYWSGVGLKAAENDTTIPTELGF